ncbi:hypothetical protein V3589_27120 [Sinorhizobium fredii]|uniref:hypothetical protein n=1 Tax=Rhizobium fredii TaxID=380 RepID=UPI0030ADEFF3
MTMPAIDRPRSAAAPVFLNFRSEVVRPVRFALVYWDGPGDTLYAFEDQEAFERQRATAERHSVHVHQLAQRRPQTGLPLVARPFCMRCRSPALRPSAT